MYLQMRYGKSDSLLPGEKKQNPKIIKEEDEGNFDPLHNKYDLFESVPTPLFPKKTPLHSPP
jgi:hypothetical protein